MTVFYDRYARRVYSVAYRIVGTTSEAEEIVQEISLRVWMRAHLIDDSVDLLRPWLITIARNLAIDYLRTARKTRCEYTNYELVPTPCDRSLGLSPHEPAIGSAFAALPVEQRTVLEFAYLEGLSQTEIAVRIGRPLGTVKTWTRTALVSLRKTLTQRRKRGNRAP